GGDAGSASSPSAAGPGAGGASAARGAGAASSAGAPAGGASGAGWDVVSADWVLTQREDTRPDAPGPPQEAERPGTHLPGLPAPPARCAAPRPSRSGLPVARRLARRAPPRPVARRLAQEAGGSAIQTSMARPQVPPGGAVRVRPSCRVRSSSTRDGGPYGATWSAIAAMITGRRPAARTL